MSSAEEVLALVEAGGAHVPELMHRLERRLEALATSHGELLAEHAGATIRAGGKRLRPLLVFLAAGERAEPNHDGVLRAAVAVELIHSATLVHDDVLDAAPLRRGRPDRRRHRRARDRDRDGRPAVLARVRRAVRATAAPDEIRVLSDASSGLAEGELLQREDAWNVEVSRERYLHRCDLKTARLFQAACRLGALEGGGPGGRARATSAAASGWPSSSSTTCSTSRARQSGPASTAARTCSTARSPCPSSSPGSAMRSSRRSTCAACALRRRRRRSATAIAATGVLEEARTEALEMVAAAKADLPELPDGQRAALELVADSVADRYA